jgi:hypothetical protein
MFLKKRVKESKPKEAQTKEEKVKVGKNRIKFGMRKKLLFCMIGMIAVFCIIITLVLNFRSTSFVEEQALKDIDDKLTAFQLLLEEQEMLLESLCSSMKYELMDAFNEESGKELGEELRPMYSFFKEAYGVTHMQVSDPQLRVLTSMHDPNSVGSDGSSRPLLKKSLGLGSGRLVHGFEIGDDGLVLYATGPVASFLTTFAGVIEIGRPIDNDYLDQIKERVGVDFTVFKEN